LHIYFPNVCLFNGIIKAGLEPMVQHTLLSSVCDDSRPLLLFWPESCSEHINPFFWCLSGFLCHRHLPVTERRHIQLCFNSPPWWQQSDLFLWPPQPGWSLPGRSPSLICLKQILAYIMSVYTLAHHPRVLFRTVGGQPLGCRHECHLLWNVPSQYLPFLFWWWSLLSFCKDSLRFWFWCVRLFHKGLHSASFWRNYLA